MNLNALEAAMARQALFELAIAFVLLIGIFWVMYVLTKAAIRDGIKEGLRESGLVNAIARSGAPSTAAGLPDMRAGR